jgi:hypothetical protein
LDDCIGLRVVVKYYDWVMAHAVKGRLQCRLQPYAHKDMGVSAYCIKA